MSTGIENKSKLISSIIRCDSHVPAAVVGRGKVDPIPRLSNCGGALNWTVRTQPPLWGLPRAPSTSSHLRGPLGQRQGATPPRHRPQQLRPSWSGGRAPAAGQGEHWPMGRTRARAWVSRRGTLRCRTQRGSGPWSWRGSQARWRSKKRQRRRRRSVVRRAAKATVARPSGSPHGHPLSRGPATLTRENRRVREEWRIGGKEWRMGSCDCRVLRWQVAEQHGGRKKTRYIVLKISSLLRKCNIYIYIYLRINYLMGKLETLRK